MNRGLEPRFLPVDIETFRTVRDTFDYRCSAWSDFIEYWERRPYRLFGLESHKGEFYLHPDLLP